MGDGIWRHMAIVFCDHIIRLDRYTGVKIEYNQSGYTNSETSPSTPRPETRLQSASLPHRQLPGAAWQNEMATPIRDSKSQDEPH